MRQELTDNPPGIWGFRGVRHMIFYTHIAPLDLRWFISAINELLNK